MCSDNAAGAVNQQERLDAYIAGYVDGEGSFHVAVQRNPSTRAGWQLVPEFHVSQNAERREVLDLIKHRLGCGRIQENHRGTTDRTLVFVVRDRDDLLEKVIPFFDTYPLLSSKQKDFHAFAPHRAGDGCREAPELRRVPIAQACGHLHERRRPVSPGASGVGILNPQRPYAGHAVTPSLPQRELYAR